MLILATDTSTPYLSIALCDGDKVLAEITRYADRQHAEKLLEYTQWMLAENNTELSAIELLAVSHGPGSFTGLRVGVAAWKGLATGAGLPIMGISTLDALARRAPIANGHVCALLDAKMKEVYATIYRYENGVRSCIQEALVAPIETVVEECPEGTLFLGDGAGLYATAITEHLPSAIVLPEAYHPISAAMVALEAVALLASGVEPQNDLVSPIYLRKSQAEVMRDQKAQQASET